MTAMTNQAVAFQLNISELSKIISKLKREVHQVSLRKHVYEATILRYQRKLSRNLKLKFSCRGSISSPDRSRGGDERLTFSSQNRSENPVHAEKVARLITDLDISRGKIKSLSEEAISLSRQVKNRDDTLAQNAVEMAKLRQERVKYGEMQLRMAAVEAEKEALRMQFQRTKQEREMHTSLSQDSSRFLQNEVIRLSEELTKTRCEADAAAASSATALQSANVMQKKLGEQLANAKTSSIHMDDYVVQLEQQLSTVKSDFEQQKQTSGEEIARLTQIAGIQKEMTSQAEQRMKDFEAIVETLRQDLREKEEHPNAIRSIQSHSEVLLKTMEQALTAKQDELRQISVEQRRLKSAHAKMVQNEEGFKRTTEESKQEAKQAQREIVRLKSIIKERSKRGESAVNEQDDFTSFADGARRSSGTEGVRGRESGFGRSSAFGLENSVGRGSDFADPEIGPRSTIPLHHPQSSNIPMDVEHRLEELMDIRMRHKRILMSLQGRD